MMLVISVSHADLPGALRQMGWIGFLSEKAGHSMLNERVLIVGSRRASRFPRFKQLTWLAARIFGEARCFVPDDENECGWPGAANWMFSKALFHNLQFFNDDIFFLEPDGTPTKPDWYDQIQKEWVEAQSNGKTFMGAYVPHTPSHMTGIAVYGRDWKKAAPSLVTCPPHDAWDTWSAPEVVPNCHFVDLIQHIFRRHEPGWSIPSLEVLKPKTVLFHQDKRGKLIGLLDIAFHAGECAAHPMFSYTAINDGDTVMRKFYYADNATRAVFAGGRRIVFETLECHGGSIPGAYTTDKEGEQAALAEATSNPSTGVSEITEKEWENCTKKKAPQSTAPPTSPLSKGTLPQAAILPTPSKSPAVLVAEPSSSPSSDQQASGPIKDIADVIKTDTVEPAVVANIGTKLPRPEKKKQFNLARNTQ